MIKATGIGPSGNKTLIIGLSFGNLDRFRAQPLDSYITISGKEVGVDHDVMIFAGRTEAEITELLAKSFGPETKVHISDRLKN